MLNKLYATDIYATKQFTIVSSVINLAAHMREFYWSRYHVNSTIYLVYADESSNNHRQFYLRFGENRVKETRDYDKINSIIESVNSASDFRILCSNVQAFSYIFPSLPLVSQAFS